MKELLEKCKSLLKIKEGRIFKVGNKLFFIKGELSSLVDDNSSYWSDSINGERIDFDYIKESVIASGDTEEELIDSIKKYITLCDMTWEQYFLNS